MESKLANFANDLQYIIRQDSITYEIKLSNNKSNISVKIKRKLSPYHYEGLFTIEDLGKINKILTLFDNLNKIYTFIAGKFEEKIVKISESDNMVVLNIPYSFDGVVEYVEIKVSANQNVDLLNVVNEISLSVHNLVNRFEGSYMNDSSIIKEHEEGIIKTWIGGVSLLSRIYKATVDGDKPADFHKACDNKGPTLSVYMTSEGTRFGGFIKLPWDQINTYKTNDAGAFIFSLDNQKKFPITNQNNVIFVVRTTWPTLVMGILIVMAYM
jgi:hypothetical protein